MTKSIFELTGQACHRELEKIASIQFAVSGPRNVAAFLFENKKRVRIYDMEADELSDEELDDELDDSELETAANNARMRFPDIAFDPDQFERGKLQKKTDFYIKLEKKKILVLLLFVN